jgi:mannose-6-phosphate isomerase-like protein (cupin superfamily)
MANARTIFLGSDEGRRYDMGPLSAVFKADGEETLGRCSISEWWLDAHTRGPGVHHHPEDDIFFVLGGTMSFYVDGDWHDAAAGAFVLVPGGVPHTFENRTDARAGALNISVPGHFEERMPGIAEWFRSRTPNEADTRSVEASSPAASDPAAGR